MAGLSDWLIGRSPAMESVRNLVEKVGPTDATVLLTGESGSGQKLVAHAIHTCSARRAGPFLSINCAAMPATMIESELFGSEPNGADGSSVAQSGLVERARGGTLFLDDITEMMGVDVQTRVLRFLETHRALRVGGSREIATDVRVVAATHRSGSRHPNHASLRDNLLYRLGAFPIHLAPLRERTGDAALLADYFLAELNTRNETDKVFSSEARRIVREYNWPGNVRELKNEVRRAYILCEQELELPSMTARSSIDTPLSTNGMGAEEVDGGIRVPIGSSLAQAERWLIEATLEHVSGNKNRAAKTLGCSLKTLYNKLAIYERQGMQAQA